MFSGPGTGGGTPVFPVPSGAVFTARLTAAAAVNLPASGYHLVKIKLIGGATPGALSILFNGTAKAIFPQPSDGTRGHAVYEIEWGPVPQTLQAALFTFTGGLSVAELVFEKTPRFPEMPISKYRGILFARTDAGAVNAGITVSYDEGPAKPRSIVGFISASAGRAQPPSVGGVQGQYEALVSAEYQMGPRNDHEYAFPMLIEAQNSLTLTVISDAASTSQYTVYY